MYYNSFYLKNGNRSSLEDITNQYFSAMATNNVVCDFIGSQIDYTNAMKVSVYELALKDVLMLLNNIWCHVTDLLDLKSTVYKGITKDQVVSCFYRVRNEASNAVFYVYAQLKTFFALHPIILRKRGVLKVSDPGTSFPSIFLESLTSEKAHHIFERKNIQL